MTRQTPCHDTTFGYLSVLESAEHGYFGGYLLISPLGRPLEFHCTAPIRPSRAQQILYGPTLRPFLVGEQIGATLLAKAELKPSLVITDQPAALCLRSQMNTPLVQIHRGDNAGAGSSARLEALNHRWELPPGYETDRMAIESLLTTLAKHVDLAEPFDRIHEAIREAQRIGGRGPEQHGHAA